MAWMGFRGRASVAGIDLGTTNSVICVQAPAKGVGTIDCIPDPATGSPIVPSVVSFLDVAESGAAMKGDTGMGIYQEMMDVFVQVASPFQNYQQRFDLLEKKHLQVATHLVNKDIHEAVKGVAALEALQDATERLKDLAPFIFPMVQGSLDRFELLNGGYRVGPALGSVDAILTNHVGELVIAIQTLSAAMTADVDQLASVFDEQHVLCTANLSG